MTSSVASTSIAVASVSIDVNDVVEAAQRLGTDVHHTPLLSSATLTARVGARELRVKGEHLQRSGSFKIRGALNAIRRLGPAERAAGVVAFSSGNHAQGVALAARIEGLRATIVMPSDAPKVKIEATRGYGASIVFYDRTTEDREMVAAQIVGQHGATLIPPFDHRDVIAGQGTVGLEAVGDWPDIDVAVVPVGGGGLGAGMALALHDARPQMAIWGVEPEAADDGRRSLAAGEIVRIAQPSTIADGVATTALGHLTFPVLQKHLSGIVTVTEAEILYALGFILTRMKQVVEPTGALTTAALLAGKIDVGGQRVLTVFCGGNLDLDVLMKVTR